MMDTLASDMEMTVIERAIVKAMVSAICAELRADADRDEEVDEKDPAGASDAGQVRL